MGKRVRIGVFGHYGHLNLGDEAIIAALLQSIRRRRPDAEICAFSDNPEDTQYRHQVVAFPIKRKTFVPGVSDNVAAPARTHSGNDQAVWRRFKGWLREVPVLGRLLLESRALVSLPGIAWEELKFLPKAFRSLRGIDLLIVAGSNQFLDNWGGTWGYPYTLLKWSILAKLAGAKLAFVSVGAGPIDRAPSKMMIRTALFLSDYTSYRDEASRRLIETLGFRRGGAVYPDLAYSLSLEDGLGNATTQMATGRRPTVGINAMARYDGRYLCYSDELTYQRYVANLATFSARLIREGYPFFFFNTQVRDDDEAFHDVWRRLRAEFGESAPREQLFRRSHSVSELMATLASADLVVATRFHGTVLALLAERPVLALCYYRKAQDLMGEMGQAEYAVKLEDFDVEDGWRRFKTLERNRIVEQEKIRVKIVAYREALDHQYAHVLRQLLPAVGH